jgi:hypothetical protein
MAWMLVSLAQTKQMLRVDTDDDDALLTLLISAASRAVARYLKGQAGTLLSVDSPPDSPPNDLSAINEDIAVATIILVGHFYRSPDNDVDAAFEQGYLPRPVTAILYPLRDPALA